MGWFVEVPCRWERRLDSTWEGGWQIVGTVFARDGSGVDGSNAREETGWLDSTFAEVAHGVATCPDSA